MEMKTIKLSSMQDIANYNKEVDRFNTQLALELGNFFEKAREYGFCLEKGKKTKEWKPVVLSNPHARIEIDLQKDYGYKFGSLKNLDYIRRIVVIPNSSPRAMFSIVSSESYPSPSFSDTDFSILVRTRDWDAILKTIKTNMAKAARHLNKILV